MCWDSPPVLRPTLTQNNLMAPHPMSCCSEGYPLGQVVGLGRIPDAGSTFGGWSGDADCSDAQVTMNADVSCTATFDLATLTVTATSAEGRAQAGGTVTSNPAGINCGDAGTDCSQAYSYGTVLTLTATRSGGFFFSALDTGTAPD